MPAMNLTPAPANDLMMRDVSSLLLSSGALLAAWGVFVRFNRAAEELEPEAMHRAKQEDKKLE